MATKNRAAAELGRLGGKKGGVARAAAMTPEQRQESARKAATARMEKLSPDQRSEIARRAVQSRWSKPKARILASYLVALRKALVVHNKLKARLADTASPSAPLLLIQLDPEAHVTDRIVGRLQKLGFRKLEEEDSLCFLPAHEPRSEPSRQTRQAIEIAIFSRHLPEVFDAARPFTVLSLVRHRTDSVVRILGPKFLADERSQVSVTSAGSTQVMTVFPYNP